MAARQELDQRPYESSKEWKIQVVKDGGFFRASKK